MGVISGQLPYRYNVSPLPLHLVPGLPDIGISGVHLEQSHFVLEAEIRRAEINFGMPIGDDPIAKYVNVAIAKEFSEASGVPPFYLDTPVNYPGAANFVDQILDSRVLLETVLLDVGFDSDFEDLDVYRNWLSGVYPNPSGANGNFFHRAPSETGLIDYIAPLENVLGQSGVLYDIDIAEIMYQPTVRFARGLDINGHDEDSFNILAKPIWPCFQKTDGTLVTLNSRDQNLADFTPGRILPFHSNPFQDSDGMGYWSVFSGVLQFDGDVFKEDLTDYFITPSGGEFIDTLTYLGQGSRKIGKANDGTNAYSRVFVQPMPLAQGLYQLAVRNRKSLIPYTIIESGFISQWPSPRDLEIHAHADKANLSERGKRGYGVFDDTFWLTDNGTHGLPSGLSIVNPFTGDIVWVRHADRAQGTDPQDWSNLRGLEHLGGSIFRVARASFNSGGTEYLFFHEFDENLDFITEHASDVSLVPGITSLAARDMFFDPDNNQYCVVDNTLNAREFYIFDSGFNFVSDHDSGTHLMTAAARLNNAYWALNSNIMPARHVQRFDLNGSALDFFETKIVQVEMIPGLSGQMGTFGVLDAQNIVTANAITTGIWFLCAAQNNNLYLLRVNEDTTAWEVLEAINLNAKNNTVNGGFPNFIYMDVN
jgi:hypothetical protein